MSRPALVVTVALASYALFNVVLSTAVCAAWRLHVARRESMSASRRARTLLRLRTIPIAGAIAITFAAALPAFVIFEPERASETPGLLVILLAAVALAQLAASGAIAIVTSLRTRAAARYWLDAGVPLDVDPPAGVPAYAVESAAPIVALVGAFKPKLVAARSVIDVCTASELTAIVAHERGHLHAHDNLKRWLMACAPDALRWTPVHHEIATAWHDAAEDAADDAATLGDAVLRTNLAALIVKIARLAPAPAWREATVSPFIEPGGLNRRVRRLLTAGTTEEGKPGRDVRRALILVTAVVVAAAIITQPATLERLYVAIEAVIDVGR
jgi:hypothetical protein